MENREASAPPRGGERCQTMLWPYYLGMTGTVITVVGWLCNSWVGFEPWVQAVLWIGVISSLLGVAAIHWDRDRIRCLEIEELRSEIQALRDRL